MTVEEMRRRLEAAMPIRVPLWDPNIQGRAKVEALEDYLAQTAFHRAELEEALYWAWETDKPLRDTWDRVEGWQNLLPKEHRTKPTEKAKADAKRQIDAVTYAALRDLKTLIDGLTRQIERLKLDDANTSRRYSLLAGS